MTVENLTMHLNPKLAWHLYLHLADYFAGLMLALTAGSCAYAGLGVAASAAILATLVAAIVYIWSRT